MTLPAQRAAFLQKAEEERKKREAEEKKRQEEAEKRKAARIRHGNTGSGHKPSSTPKSKSTIKPPARQEAPITPRISTLRQKIAKQGEKIKGTVTVVSGS